IECGSPSTWLTLNLEPGTLNFTASFHLETFDHFLKSFFVLVDGGFGAVELEEIVAAVFGLNDRAEHAVIVAQHLLAAGERTAGCVFVGAGEIDNLHVAAADG